MDCEKTVSSLLCFFLAMSLYPEVQKKAQEEIDRVIGPSRLPNAADREKLPSHPPIRTCAQAHVHPSFYLISSPPKSRTQYSLATHSRDITLSSSHTTAQMILSAVSYPPRCHPYLLANHNATNPCSNNP